MSTCTFPLSFKPMLFHKHSSLQPNLYSTIQLSKTIHRSLSSTLLRCSNQERNEALWLREEQRWLREEQRWLREESRWRAERETLLRTISALQLQIQEFEHQNPRELSKLVLGKASQKNLLEGVSVPILNQIAELGSGPVPLVLNAVEEKIEKKEEEVRKKRGTLRTGCEGDEVKEMQEALQKLGFYCGEEDVEFSSFSSTTERAVKTWQASLGAPEDGIMTAELLEILYTEDQIVYTGVALKEDPKGTADPKENANGAPVPSVTRISDTHQKIVEDKGNDEVDVSQHRVFLLGENRWEDSSRLIGRNKANGGTKSKRSTKQCLCCRGEGRLLCAECDGSGEPNIESQFLEWVDEGMKCLYCEGLGFTTCDVCDGQGIAAI